MKKNSRKNWKKIATSFVALVALAIAGGQDFLRDWQNGQGGTTTPTTIPRTDARLDNKALLQAIAQRRDGVMVLGQGVVERVLADDNEGSRHQRFILDVGDGKTLLVAHNIDLAPRLPDLKAGDEVRFYAQYETNQRDGVLHWTHHDPGGQHEDGWLEYQGRRYE